MLNWPVGHPNAKDENGNYVKKRIGFMTPEEWSESRGQKKKLTEFTLREVLEFQRYRHRILPSNGAVGPGLMPTALFGKHFLKDSTMDLSLIKNAGLDLESVFSKENQDKIGKPLLNKNTITLKDAGVPTTPGWQYMSWYLGPGGAIEIWKASKDNRKDMKIADILDKAHLPGSNNAELKYDMWKESGIKNTATNFASELEWRLTHRGSLHMSATGEASVEVKGNQLEQSSKDSKDLKNNLNEKSQGSTNTTNINHQSSSNNDNRPPENANDENVLKKKGQGKK